jgi:hypothetical protein
LIKVPYTAHNQETTISVHDDGVEAVDAVERQLEPSTPLRRRRLAGEKSLLLLSVRLLSRRRFSRAPPETSLVIVRVAVTDVPYPSSGASQKTSAVKNLSMAMDELLPLLCCSMKR